MEIKKNKCSSIEHEEIDANSYCQECKIYICKKCETIHSKLCKNHHVFILEKYNNNEEIFTGFCNKENHNDKLIFFCKNHNQLCCPACICKIKIEGFGFHKDCDVCLIKDIKDEKMNKLKENIKSLEELSKTLDESINNLKEIFEKINENKEELKLKIQKVFTKIRNEINNREDELLLEVNDKFDKIFFNEEMLKESEKLPNKIKIFLNKGKVLDKEYNENNLALLINDCINIEQNFNDINNIKSKIKESKDLMDLKIKFYPEEEEINAFLENLKKFGKIEQYYFIESSSILNNNINEQELIINWIKEKTNKNDFKFKLIYKMSEKGKNCKTFHEYCDNKGPTLILIETTTNRKFGGFTPLNWKSEGAYIYDESNQTFIFSLNLKEKYDMLDKKKMAIQCYSNKGPNFGATDFSLKENMSKGQTYANNGCTFLKDHNLELTGGKGEYESFDTKEFEVFQVNFYD